MNDNKQVEKHEAIYPEYSGCGDQTRNSGIQPLEKPQDVIPIRHCKQEDEQSVEGE
jgi:hypothetical protein